MDEQLLLDNKKVSIKYCRHVVDMYGHVLYTLSLSKRDGCAVESLNELKRKKNLKNVITIYLRYNLSLIRM